MHLLRNVVIPTLQRAAMPLNFFFFFYKLKGGAKCVFESILKSVHVFQMGKSFANLYNGGLRIVDRGLVTIMLERNQAAKGSDLVLND